MGGAASMPMPPDAAVTAPIGRYCWAADDRMEILSVELVEDDVGAGYLVNSGYGGGLKSARPDPSS